MYLQLFVDDTNALVAKKDSPLREFWTCLHIFCVTSGFANNHQKIGVKSRGSPIPDWLKAQGCKEIQEGEVFRLLGIPMGFKVSMHQRWEWVMSKLTSKLSRWENITLSFAGRILVINHYIVPATLFFLACWRPTHQALKSIQQICSSFLWAGQPLGKRIPKVKWSICTLTKEKGGLGIRDVAELANRLASKWILKGFFHPDL